MKAPPNGFLPNAAEGEKKAINSELWHACAGPLVSLPPVGSLVVYFPQGHSEQVAASMQKETEFIPSYPNLPSKMVCILHNVTLHADPETDEVYAQMTLQPVSKLEKEAILASEIGMKQSRQPAEFFCKTLTASDTSTHGGFSVPRRAAEKIFPPLDFSMQPPAQELVARDLHDHSWTFRHIYRGQPKRHLLTTGWSVFVSTKRLFAGDSVLFIRDDKSQLLLGVRRANRQQPALSSSVISSDSMHIGILAAAAHAAASNSPFVIFFNPRASPAEFVIPFSKYNKAMYTQVSLGMRFRMMFETEESGVRRYMGTITGISDLDPVRWKNSQWRNLQVGWDESAAGDRPSRVSIWDIEPVVTPFYICPPPFFRPKFPKQPGMEDEDADIESVFKRAMPWLGDDFASRDASGSLFPGMSLVQWMKMQQNSQFPSNQSSFLQSLVSPSGLNTDDPAKLLNFQSPNLPVQTMQVNKANPQNQVQSPLTWNQQQMQSPVHQQLSTYAQQQRLPQVQPQMQNDQQPQVQQQQARLPASHLPQSQVLQVPYQQPVVMSQVHQKQQQFLAGNSQAQAGSKSPYQLPSLPLESSFPRQLEPVSVQQQHLQLLQQNMPQRVQPPQQPPPHSSAISPPVLSDQQLQLLQKLQQQHQQQLLTSGSMLLRPQQQSLQPPLPVHQNQELAQNPHNAFGCNSLPPSSLSHSQLFSGNQNQVLQKPLVSVKALSALTDGDAPSCSTSPSTNNCQISPSTFINRSQQGPSILIGDTMIDSTISHMQEKHGKSDIRVKHESPVSKAMELTKYKGTITDPLEASSSGTSYCLDAGTFQHNYSLPAVGLDGDVQSQPRNNISFTSTIDGLAPDALLSRGYETQKDLQNLLFNYGDTPRDIETELSTAALSSQSFGVRNVPFKPACANDVTINEPGVFSGMWAGQNQRMRTYTKVQKRGSVGRSIDVTRYKGYDELRHDLARMFGIEGQLEDPQSSDWKLVYVDHENDILLVGDDPWEEFVGCVQSLKILSSAEVEQMSLDGNLGNVPVPNQACSGTDSGNAWRPHYEDHSAASFNR